MLFLIDIFFTYSHDQPVYIVRNCNRFVNISNWLICYLKVYLVLNATLNSVTNKHMYSKINFIKTIFSHCCRDIIAYIISRRNLAPKEGIVDYVLQSFFIFKLVFSILFAIYSLSSSNSLILSWFWSIAFIASTISKSEPDDSKIWNIFVGDGVLDRPSFYVLNEWINIRKISLLVLLFQTTLELLTHALQIFLTITRVHMKILSI